MQQLALILGGAGVLLILVGLIGGNFTFSGSVVPKVGGPGRVLSFTVGGLLTLTAIVLASMELVENYPPGPDPVPPTPPVSSAAGVGSAATGAVWPPAGYTSVPLLDAPSSAGSVVGELPGGSMVRIHCTLQGEGVERPDGSTSSLWNAIEGGYLPDAWTDTGTNQAVAPPC